MIPARKVRVIHYNKRNDGKAIHYYLVDDVTNECSKVAPAYFHKSSLPDTTSAYVMDEAASMAYKAMKYSLSDAIEHHKRFQGMNAVDKCRALSISF